MRAIGDLIVSVGAGWRRARPSAGRKVGVNLCEKVAATDGWQP